MCFRTREIGSSDARSGNRSDTRSVTPNAEHPILRCKQVVILLYLTPYGAVRSWEMNPPKMRGGAKHPASIPELRALGLGSEHLVLSSQLSVLSSASCGVKLRRSQNLVRQRGKSVSAPP